MTGSCKDGPGFMADNCAKSCGFCDLHNREERCAAKNWPRMKLNMTNAISDRELDPLFERIVATYPKVHALSRPPKGPWILQFDDFISEKEIKALLGQTLPNIARSDSQSSYHKGSRTSQHTWCEEQCQSNRQVKRVLNRIQTMTGIDKENYESIQVLRYGVGQRYGTHHDMEGEDTTELFSGPRVLTFFMYFNTVKGGGGTNFPFVQEAQGQGAVSQNPEGIEGLTVTPKRGSAILWANCRNSNLQQALQSTHHQALPVTAGKKFAGNVWIHQRNLQHVSKWGCRGKPDYDAVDRINPPKLVSGEDDGSGSTIGAAASWAGSLLGFGTQAPKVAPKETADDGGGGEGQGEARQLDALREELESLAMPVALLQTLVDMQITTVEQLFQSFTVDQMKTVGMNIGQRNRLVRRSKQRTGL